MPTRAVTLKEACELQARAVFYIVHEHVLRVQLAVGGAVAVGVRDRERHLHK